MTSTEISIDRITLIAYDNGRFKHYLNNSIYINVDKNRKRTYGFTHAFKGLQGEFIEMNEKGKVRIDFNPNKTKTNGNEIAYIFSHLKYPHLTRFDIAIDYYNIDFQNIEWSSIRARKRNYWTDGYGKLETLYIGSPRSNKQFRIYNKSLEMEEKKKESVKGHWWRVEVQQRFKGSNTDDPDECLLSDLFDIKPYPKQVDISFIDKFSERTTVGYLLEHPEELKKADKKTRAKYTKLIREVKERAGAVFENPPHEVYEKEKCLIADQLKGIFSKFAKLETFGEAI